MKSLPVHCLLGWTQDCFCTFVCFPAPQHLVLKACELGLHDEGLRKRTKNKTEG